MPNFISQNDKLNTLSDSDKEFLKAVVKGTGASRQYNDDAYLSQIAEYSDKPFYQYLLTNPWLWSKQGRFSPNLFQQIAESLGDFSARDNYDNTILSNQQQWLSEALEKFRQEQYNSPLEQVAREKMAGLNPDLNGNVDSGMASENDQPILGHPQFGSDGSLESIGSFFMNVYQLASGMAKDSFSMQSMMNQLTSEDLDINNKIISATTDFIKGSVGSPYKGDDGNFIFPDLSLDKLDSYAKSMFRSRSARNRFKKEVQSSYSSARSRFTQYGVLKDENDAKRALARSLGESSAMGDEFEPMVKVSERLNKLAIDIQEYQSKYTSDYFHNANGSLASSASNESNRGIVEENQARSYQRGMDKIINETMNKIVSDLSKESRYGGLEGLIAKGMLGFISAYRLQMLPSLPAVNLSGLIQNRNFNTTNNTY